MNGFISGLVMDVILIAILIFFVALGVRKGAAKSVVGVCSFVVTIVLFAILRAPLQKLLLNLPFVQSWIDGMAVDFSTKNNLEEMAIFFAALDSTAELVAKAVANFIISIVVFALIYVLSIFVSMFVGGLLVKVMKLPVLRSVNKLLGGILGATKGLIAVWVLTALLVLFGISDDMAFVKAGIENGFLVKLVYDTNILLTLFKG